MISVTFCSLNNIITLINKLLTEGLLFQITKNINVFLCCAGRLFNYPKFVLTSLYFIVFFSSDFNISMTKIN